MRRTRAGLVGVGGVVLVTAAAAAAILLTGSGSGSGLKTAVVVPPAVSTFPKPPAGAFVTARPDGSDVLALAVIPKTGGVALQVSDVTQDGVGARNLRVSFAVAAGDRTRTAQATACGAGCYRARVSLPSRPRTVEVHVARSSRSTSWTVALPSDWPAKDGSAIIARATRTWKQLRSLRYSERLSSDPVHAVLSNWQIVAPDRLAYQIHGEGQAVIIGVHRWDKQQGASWVKTSALRLHQPIPFWVEATDARVAGSATVQGHAVWRVSFFDPRTPGWFLAAVDKKTYRTLDVHMTAAAHFMHDTYGGFNTSIKIVVPSTS